MVWEEAIPCDIFWNSILHWFEARHCCAVIKWYHWKSNATVVVSKVVLKHSKYHCYYHSVIISHQAMRQRMFCHGMTSLLSMVPRLIAVALPLPSSSFLVFSTYLFFRQPWSSSSSLSASSSSWPFLEVWRNCNHSSYLLKTSQYCFEGINSMLSITSLSKSRLLSETA